MFSQAFWRHHRNRQFKNAQGGPTILWSSYVVTNHPNRKYSDFPRQFPTVQHRNRFYRRYPASLVSKPCFPRLFGATTEINCLKIPRAVRHFFCRATSLRTIPIENILIFPDNSRPSSTEIDFTDDIRSGLKTMFSQAFWRYHFWSSNVVTNHTVKAFRFFLTIPDSPTVLVLTANARRCS